MSLFSKDMYNKIIGFSAMVNNNITRTEKQRTATLVKVLTKLLSS